MPTKKALRVAPDFDESIEDVIKPFFDDFYSISFRNYKIDDDYLHWTRASYRYP